MLIKQDAKRVVWLDCLRAILIILMVFGHAGSEYNTFIYLAHIPGFFVVSGYTSHLKSEICDYLYIKKRIVTVLDTVDNSQINVLTQRTMHRICTAATNEEVSFAYRVAIPRQRFRWRNAFSTRWRSL